MFQAISQNPVNFEKDLSKIQLHEMEIYTQFARNRLTERDISIADLKKQFLSGEKIDRPPLMIPDFPARLIGAPLCDYYTNTLTHYKAYCAALARFGEDIVMTYTVTWEYKLVELLGGTVSYISDKAPETKLHPLTSEKEIESLPTIDLENLLAEDLALKVYIDRKLGDLIGAGSFVTLDPFSQVCSLLRSPNELMIDVIDNPAFVHALCNYMYEILREVMKKIVNTGPPIFFLPGYTLMLSPDQFNEFALPYIEKLIADFPEVIMIIGSGGNATHLIEPIMKSNIPLPFIDGASDLKTAVETGKQYKKPFTVLFPRTVLMNGQRSEIRATTKHLLQTVKDIPFYYWTDAILGGDVPNSSIDMFIEAYKEYAHYPIEDFIKDDINGIPPESGKIKSVDPTDIVWDEESRILLNKVPFMFRKMVKKDVIELSASRGIREITREIFEEIKKQKGY